MKVYTLHLEDGSPAIVSVFLDEAKAYAVAERLGWHVEEHDVAEYDAREWPPGESYYLKVVERRTGPAWITVDREGCCYNASHQRGWQCALKTNHPLLCDPPERVRIHIRSVWVEGLDRARGIAEAKADELQHLPFDR